MEAGAVVYGFLVLVFLAGLWRWIIAYRRWRVAAVSSARATELERRVHLWRVPGTFAFLMAFILLFWRSLEGRSSGSMVGFSLVAVGLACRARSIALSVRSRKGVS